MSDGVLMSSSAGTPVNCVATAPGYDVTQLLTTVSNDVSVDLNAPIPYPLRVAGASIGSVCLVVGVLGNLLVLLSLWRYRPLRRTVNLFVASLAVCDLTQTLAVRTLHIQTYVAGRWTLGAQTCVYALVVSNLVILEDIVTFLETFLNFFRTRRPPVLEKLLNLGVLTILEDI